MSERVLITGVRAPAALDLARSLNAAGFEAHMADCVPARIARWSKTPHAVHRHASPVHQPAGFARDLRGLIDTLAPVAVIPACEEVFHLSALAATQGWADRLIAPPPDTLAELHHKGRFAALCRRLGLPVPETATVTDRAELMRRAENTDVVVKPAWSRFGARTLIAPDTPALSRITPSTDAPWAVQTRVRGDEVSFYVVARQGRLTAFSAYRSDWRLDGGATYVFQPLTDPLNARLRAMAETLAAHAVTGQIACDAIVDADGAPWLIECNPRATSGVHLFDRSAAFGLALLDRANAEAAPPVVRNSLAMDSFGLTRALRQRRLTSWRDQRRASRDILAAPGDTGPRWGALADAAVFGLRALASGRSLAEAMTADIEWNGQPLTPARWETS
jgi:carbamoylphosphate synthase large subunit